MLCKICKRKGQRKKAVVYLRQHRLALCKEHFKGWFERQVEKAVKKYKMFSKNDKLLVAVSGGKDSLALWLALSNLGFKTAGLFIDLGIEGYSEEAKETVKNFSKKLGKPLFIFSLKKEFGYTLEEIVKRLRRKDACSVCGTIKRYVMNKAALDFGGILATGHNLDDESAVLLSNTLRWEVGYLQRQHPVLKESEGFARKVKPLCFLTEKETVSYAILNGIDFLRRGCPLSKGATSRTYKEALAFLEHKMPGTKLRFYREFLKKAQPIFSSADRTEGEKLSPCKNCGMPTTAGVCSVCRILEKVKNAESGQD